MEGWGMRHGRFLANCAVIVRHLFWIRNTRSLRLTSLHFLIYCCSWLRTLIKGTVSRDLLLHVYCSSPKLLKITSGSFSNFSKIREDIRKSRCTTGMSLTGGKFSTCVNYTGGKLPQVSTTNATNLPPVVHLEPRISPRIFEKILYGPYENWFMKKPEVEISWLCPY